MKSFHAALAGGCDDTVWCSHTDYLLFAGSIRTCLTPLLMSLEERRTDSNDWSASVTLTCPLICWDRLFEINTLHVCCRVLLVDLRMNRNP